MAAGTSTNSGAKYEVRFLNLDTGRPIDGLKDLPGIVASLAFSPDGRTIAVAAAAPRSFSLWDVATKREVRRMTTITQRVVSLAFAPDGKSLCSVGDSGEVDSMMWRLVARSRLFSSRGACREPWPFPRMGSRSRSTAGKPSCTSSILPRRRDRLSVPEAHLAEVQVAVFADRGHLLITGSDDRTVRVWDVATGRQRTLLPHDGWVRCLAISADERWLLTGSHWRDGMVCLWDLSTGRLKRVWRRPPDFHFPIGLAFSEDQASALALWNDGMLDRWDLDTGMKQEIPQPILRQDRRGEMEGRMAHSGHFSPKSDKLAVLSGGTSVFDLSSGKPLYRKEAGSIFVFSPDGRMAAASSQGKSEMIPLADGGGYSEGTSADAVIHVESATTGEERRTMVIPSASSRPWPYHPTAVCWLSRPTSRQAGPVAQIHVFQIASKREIKKFEVSCPCTSALVFSPDGKSLACGLRDTSVVIFDVSVEQ